MKIKRLAYIAGAVICTILTMAFRTVALPVALVYEALNAMATNTSETADDLISKK